jgi:fused signal recognition particle receptor
MLNFFKKKTKKSKDNKLSDKIKSLFHNPSDGFFEELEKILINSDVGVEITNKLLKSLKVKSSKQDQESLKGLLKKELQKILPENSTININNKKPFVILVVGVNGAGKTTTIGKIAHFYKKQDKQVILAAGDTFRAAAVEQLKIWGERNDIPVVAQQTGSDSASVAFDALQSAEAKKKDILIIDTAGRLHTQNNLMDELAKIKRVLSKNDETIPHEVLLVIDGNSGQNAVLQAKEFNKKTKLTGLVLTKLDSTAKGGVIFNISQELDLPIRFIGIGEQIDDLKVFKRDEFIDTLF